MPKDLFPSKDDSLHPQIYAFSIAAEPEYLKVGYTTRDDVNVRIKEQIATLGPAIGEWKVVFSGTAMRNDGSVFMDHDIHRALKAMHCVCQGGEWYRCTLDQLTRAYKSVLNRTTSFERVNNFRPRPEQDEAITKTMRYFNSASSDGSGRTPKFLWNAKMRFGKTFASYELAKEMGLKKVLVLTFKPAVKSAWKEDLETHVDFAGWQFISQPTKTDLFTDDIGQQYEKADKRKPIVCFGSFQDFLGVDKATGTIKERHKWVRATNWDIVIFDEYHFGAWREKAKDLFDKEDDEKDADFDLLKEMETYDKDSVYDESFLPITTNYYLYLSGTPFRAINSGEFIEEQIFSWTYSDEQNAKENWDVSKGANPYAALPRMVMLTYKMPESIRKIAMQGEFNEFDLNVFFSTEGEKDKAKFVFEVYVQKWLDLMRGQNLESSVEDLKTGRHSPFPYSDARLRSVLDHTLWFMPNVSSCYAMRNLLNQKQNSFYHSYRVIVCAGTEAGQGADALIPVERAMDDPLKTQTITLSCGKLTTGVTVKPWTAIFMLRNLKQPETYFQAAFRVQSPWTASGEIIKKECYVFDFAPNRTLRQLSEYSCRLNVKERDPEIKVKEFIKFLPVLAYEGNQMREIDAGEILDIAMSGTSATLLARRWESALLVNVTNDVLARLLNNPDAMAALMSIEGFRNLNSDLETIINKSESVKKAKKEGGKKDPKTQKEIDDDEKEYKSKRKEIQEKLIKFATRIPIFMYLTDFREVCLQDVITKLEPGLFKKVTGLYVKDFELLCSLGLFNEDVWNDAIFKFRRYEEASLDYTGINKHAGEPVGGWSTVLSVDDFNALYRKQSDEEPAVNKEENTIEPQITRKKDERLGKQVKTINLVKSEGYNNQLESKTQVAETPPKPKIVLVKKVPKSQVSTQTGINDTKESHSAMDVKKDDWIISKTYGSCTVLKVDSDKITLKTKKGKTVVFKFPGAFEKGELK
ncbi:MAG: GIY-YIG nuclease family protein [Candidatus Cloacimonetes bacterium]|nr:GIY-YIG nuclease family protein [Candidatus Cloacimonadota bacterium]